MRVQKKLWGQMKQRGMRTQGLRMRLSVISKSDVQFYKDWGYLQLENMLSDEQIEQVKRATADIVEQEDPYKDMTEFTSGTDGRGQSFLDSGDKIKLFFEPGVRDQQGHLKVDKHLAYNKMGHAMHDLHPVFEQISYQQRIEQVLQAIGYIEPVLVQSMYIFKNPKVGQKVDPHTDNTFLMTTPRPSTVALWVALDAATELNGCLWGVPGSHLQPTHQFFKANTQRTTTYFHNTQQGQQKHIDTERAVALPVPKGGALLFSGDFVHFSHHNSSHLPRHAYTMHFVDLHNNHWATDNWLQRPTLPFRPYYQRVQQLN